MVDAAVIVFLAGRLWLTLLTPIRLSSLSARSLSAPCSVGFLPWGLRHSLDGYCPFRSPQSRTRFPSPLPARSAAHQFCPPPIPSAPGSIAESQVRETHHWYVCISLRKLRRSPSVIPAAARWRINSAPPAVPAAPNADRRKIKDGERTSGMSLLLCVLRSSLRWIPAATRRRINPAVFPPVPAAHNIFNIPHFSFHFTVISHFMSAFTLTLFFR